MEKQESKLDILKRIDKIDLAYLGVILVMLIIVIILFFYTTSFILKNVNKIFNQTNEIDSHALNMDNYSLIERKLKLPINNTMVEPTIESSQEVISDTIPPSAPEATKPTLDNKSLTINVLNGARKAGIAGTMVTELEAAGFSKGTTGDSKTIYPITTIMIKDSKKDYTKAIEEVVKKNHPKATTKVNPEKSGFDVIIIVGKL